MSERRRLGRDHGRGLGLGSRRRGDGGVIVMVVEHDSCADYNE